MLKRLFLQSLTLVVVVAVLVCVLIRTKPAREGADPSADPGQAGPPAPPGSPEDLRRQFQSLNGQLATAKAERTELLREVQAASALVNKISATEEQTTKQLNTTNAELAAAKTRAAETAKSVQELSAAVKTTRSELGTLTSAQTKEAKDAIERDKTLRETVQSVAADQKAAAAAAVKRVEEAEKALNASLATQQKETAARLAQTEAALARLRAALAVPADNELSQVLFLIDGGRRLADYRFEDVRGLLVDAIDTAARQTPNRRVGLVGCAGEKRVDHLKLGKPYLTDVDALRQNIESIKANKGEDTRWRAALDAGLNQFAAAEGKKRVVYVTCNPAEATALDPGPLAEKFRSAGVEVWVVQLVRADEKPAADLSTLATETGGQFLTVSASRDGDEKRKALSARRFAAALYSALDLRQPPAP